MLDSRQPLALAGAVAELVFVRSPEGGGRYAVKGRAMAKATKKRRNSALRSLTPAGKLLEMIAMRHVPQALHVVAVPGDRGSARRQPKDQR